MAASLQKRGRESMQSRRELERERQPGSHSVGWFRGAPVTSEGRGLEVLSAKHLRDPPPAAGTPRAEPRQQAAEGQVPALRGSSQENKRGGGTFKERNSRKPQSCSVRRRTGPSSVTDTEGVARTGLTRTFLRVQTRPGAFTQKSFSPTPLIIRAAHTRFLGRTYIHSIYRL